MSKDANSLIEKANKNQVLSIIILFMLFVVLCVIVFHKCGRASPAPDNEPIGDQFCSDGVKVGDIKKESCPDKSERILICRVPDALSEVIRACEDGSEPPPPPPTSEPVPKCTKVLFNTDVLPVMQASCASCHAGFVNYDAAVKNVDEIIRRVKLNSADQRRMPKAPLPEISPENKKTLEDWKKDGLLKDESQCQEQSGQSETLDLRYVEKTIFLDLNDNIDERDRPFIRYLVGTHRAYYSNEDLAVAKKASDKTTNSLIERERDVVQSSYVDDIKSIFRIDIRSYELSVQDWEVIERFDRFKFISNTDFGRSIRLLTGAKLPWLHSDNFSDMVLFNSNLYYFLNGTRKSLNDQLIKLGVRFNADLVNFDATLLGFNGSSISAQKNRLLSRHESQDGSAWLSFDVKPLGNVAQRNLFKFPLPANIGSNRVFFHDASELIYSLPSGLHGYALYDRFGNLQNVAPIDIVKDLISPVIPGPEIKAAISCFRCHSGGIIPAVDQVRAKVLENSTEFTVNDQERVRNLYKRQTSLNALFKVDNNQYLAALSKLGISASEPDPINVARDFFYTDYDAKKVAAFFFLPKGKFLELLSLSGDVRNEIGQLLIEGGTVSLDQLIQTAPLIFRDFKLLDEKINGGS